MQKDWMRYVWRLVALGVLATIAVLISMSAPSVNTNPSTSASAPLGFPADTPAPKAADIVTAQKRFNALVSFTEKGFEPSTITIHAGQTIRFSNNAAADLRLASAGSDLFLRASSVAPRNYVEITFGRNGQFQYSDTTTGRSGTIIVLMQ